MPQSKPSLAGEEQWWRGIEGPDERRWRLESKLGWRLRRTLRVGLVCWPWRWIAGLKRDGMSVGREHGRVVSRCYCDAGFKLPTELWSSGLMRRQSSVPLNHDWHLIAVWILNTRTASIVADWSTLLLVWWGRREEEGGIARYCRIDCNVQCLTSALICPKGSRL